MSNLIAVSYPDESIARNVAGTLQQLQTERVIQMEDMVIAVRDDKGRIKLRQTTSPAGAGAAGGALWGGLIGLIFLVPLLGMAVGAAAGAAGGALADYGIDDRFMKDLGEQLEPGGAVLFVLVRQSTPDKVIPRISEYGGTIIHTSLDDESETALREALETGAPTPAA